MEAIDAAGARAWLATRVPGEYEAAPAIRAALLDAFLAYATETRREASFEREDEEFFVAELRGEPHVAFLVEPDEFVLAFGRGGRWPLIATTEQEARERIGAALDALRDGNAFETWLEKNGAVRGARSYLHVRGRWRRASARRPVLTLPGWERGRERWPPARPVAARPPDPGLLDRARDLGGGVAEAGIHGVLFLVCILLLPVLFLAVFASWVGEKVRGRANGGP